MQFALVELAGPEHIVFFDEFLYYYDDSFKKPDPERNRDRLAAKLVCPYQPLSSLSDQGNKIEDYNPPTKLV